MTSARSASPDDYSGPSPRLPGGWCRAWPRWVRSGSKGPVPEERRRKPRARMEPSRRGAAQACRVVISTPSAPTGATPGTTRPPLAAVIMETLRGNVSGSDALDARGEHVFPSLGQRPIGVDAAARVLDDERPESRLARVQRRPCDAEVGGQADEKDLREAAVAQITREPRRRFAVGLVERRVRVHVPAIALADDQLGVRDAEILVQVGARRALHAVIRPEHLGSV